MVLIIYCAVQIMPPSGTQLSRHALLRLVTLVYINGITRKRVRCQHGIAIPVESSWSDPDPNTSLHTRKRAMGTDRSLRCGWLFGGRVLVHVLVPGRGRRRICLNGLQLADLPDINRLYMLCYSKSEEDRQLHTYHISCWTMARGHLISSHFHACFWFDSSL